MNNSIETGDQRAKEIKHENQVPEEDDQAVYGVGETVDGELTTEGDLSADEMLERSETGEPEEGYDFSGESTQVRKSNGTWGLGASPSDPFNDEEY